jgi:hypothetical protein
LAASASPEAPDCTDATFCLVINAGSADRTVKLAPLAPAAIWRVVVDTALPEPFVTRGPRVPGGGSVRVSGRSLVLLKDSPAVVPVKLA